MNRRSFMKKAGVLTLAGGSTITLADHGGAKYEAITHSRYDDNDGDVVAQEAHTRYTGS